MIVFIVSMMLRGRVKYNYYIKARPDLKEKIDNYILDHKLQEKIEGFIQEDIEG